jgi:hypothetical protein
VKIEKAEVSRNPKNWPKSRPERFQQNKKKVRVKKN